MPDFAIREPLADGRLVRIMPAQAQRDGVFYILWPAGRHVAPKVRALVDFMCDRVFARSQSYRFDEVRRQSQGATGD